jgi:hypothetical protein
VPALIVAVITANPNSPVRIRRVARRISNITTSTIGPHARAAIRQIFGAGGAGAPNRRNRSTITGGRDVAARLSHNFRLAAGGVTHALAGNQRGG